MYVPEIKMDMRQVSKKVGIRVVNVRNSHRVMIKTGGKFYDGSDSVLLTFPFNWHHKRGKFNIRVWVKNNRAKII